MRRTDDRQAIVQRLHRIQEGPRQRGVARQHPVQGAVRLDVRQAPTRGAHAALQRGYLIAHRGAQFIRAQRIDDLQIDHGS